MLCQSCGKKEATFHYTSNDNGNITETHLCHDCAQKNGYIDESFAGLQNFNPFGFFDSSEKMFGELLSGMFADEKPKSIRESAVCPFCGMRFNEFIHGGKAGCSKCYTTFKDALAPTLKKLHGNTQHTGKIPVGRSAHRTKEQQRTELETLLKKAIETQEYEKAAEYRDRLRELDKEDAS